MYRVLTGPLSASGTKASLAPKTMAPTGPLGMPPSMAASFARAAWVSHRAGNAEKAISLYSKAIDSMASAPPISPSNWEVTVPVLNNLAALLRNHGKYADAEARYLSAIDMLSKESAPLLRPLLALVMRNLADLYHSVGQEDAARALLATAVAEDAAGKAQLPRQEPSPPTAPLLNHTTHGTHVTVAP
jgi:tetratricopeptide (TPR) repeat protein